MKNKALALLLTFLLAAPAAMAQEAEKRIALTFDDGPNETTTNAMLDKLEKYGVTASFFVIGDNITAKTQAAMLRAYTMGCEINSHSKTHSDMTKMTAEEIKAEMDYTSEKIEAVTGEKPHFFRPPYIAVNDVMHGAIDLPFICGYGANDWEPAVTAQDRADRILGQIKDGGIILLHDTKGNDQTVDALDILIPALKAQGYTFVTVSELFEKAQVTPTKGYVYTNVYQKGAWSN